MQNSYLEIKTISSALPGLQSSVAEAGCLLTFPCVWFLLILILAVPNGQTIMCSQCDSLVDPQCDAVPPTPTPCAFCEIEDTHTGRCLNYTEYNFCITMKKFVNETLISTTRSCNPISIGADCRPATDKNNRPVKICFDSCNTDGCNSGDTPMSSWRIRAACVALFLILTCLPQ